MMTNTDRTDPEDFPVEMTLPEYIEILREIEEIRDPVRRRETEERLAALQAGRRDLYF